MCMGGNKQLVLLFLDSNHRSTTMGIFTKDIKTMDDLFLHQLEDIYYAEQQLTKAIPKMAEMATNADLKAGLESHVIDTQN
jgi:Domain of unknown function (DUF892)